MATRLRSASELERIGLVTAAQKGALKDLIVTGDEADARRHESLDLKFASVGVGWCWTWDTDGELKRTPLVAVSRSLMDPCHIGDCGT